MDQGIVLAGGGALLAGLDRRVAEATQMPVHIADDPLTCVARGTGIVLQELDQMARVLVAETYAAAAALSRQRAAPPAPTPTRTEPMTVRASPTRGRPAAAAIAFIGPARVVCRAC